MLSAARRAGRVPAAFALGLALVVMLLVASPATAADECREVLLPDGTVKIICDNDDGGDGPGEPGDGGPGGGSQTCEFNEREIPCSTSFGVWDGRCYTRTAAPQPPKSAPVWEGNDDGVVLECNPPGCVGGPMPCPDRSFYWSPTAPTAPGPSPRELAERAVASMNLSMGEIGSTPPASTNNPNAVGAIGLPIWLWIANRAENTVGPIVRSASDGGLTVSATGTLNRVEWTLTDANGATVGAITCDGANAPGTPYDGRNSAEPSPTCGFGADLNSSPGTLTLTGTAYWVVEWQGGGQTGQIDVPAQSNSTQVRIGELQALVRD
jgi:hypothetical protein